MPKSIRTNSNTQNAPTLATFKAGDSVLWAAVSNDTYTLHSGKDRARLIIHHGGIDYSFGADGRSSPDDALPSLFHDTEANRQAIATLYSGTPSSQSSQRQVIDTTEASDNIVVTMSSHDLSHIASDIYGATNALNDVGHLLGLIYYGKIEGAAVKSMARLAHDSTNTWEDILRTQLDIINEPLAMTGYSKVGAE